MIYPQILRPLLFQLDAERAHDLTLNLLERLSHWPRVCQALHSVLGHETPLQLMGLRFPNRVGLAAGLDKNGVAVPAWWALGAGFVELGTVTPRPQPGNAGVRMTRLPQRRAILNRMGFNNHGAEAVAARLAALAPRSMFPIGISVGKQGTTPAADIPAVAADYAEAAAKLVPHADFITINISSPNTKGLRTLQEPAAVRPLIDAVKAVIGTKPLLVKLAPEVEGVLLESLVHTILESGAAGLIATNTLAQFSANGESMGGLSGAPLADLALKRVEAIRKIDSRCVLIGSGGIDSVATARRMMNAGADLVQVYTGLVYEGPFLIGRLSRSL